MLWHCGHSDNAGADILMFGALLESLFAFDVFRFGTAMPFTSCNLRSYRNFSGRIRHMR
jgi:hypothetical protein